MAAPSVVQTVNGMDAPGRYPIDGPSDMVLAGCRCYARPPACGTAKRANSADAPCMVNALRWLKRRLDCERVARLDYMARTSASIELPPLPSLDELARRVAHWVEQNPDRIDVPLEWLVRRFLENR